MKRYVVIFHPRSGSSWLSSIMSGFPDILEGFELLDFQTANNLGFGSDHLKNESMTYRHIYTIGEFFKHAENTRKSVSPALRPLRIRFMDLENLRVIYAALTRM